MKKEKTGLTIIEIVITVTIIGILFLIVSYYILEQLAKSKDSKIKADMNLLILAGADYAQIYDTFESFCNTDEARRIFNGIESDKKFCHHTDNAWATCAILFRDNSKAWCVDYNGTKIEIPASECGQSISSCD